MENRTETKRVLDILRVPKLMSVNCKKTSQRLPSCVITTRDSLFCKMFSPLICYEQVKTLKNFKKKLVTSKIKTKKKMLRKMPKLNIIPQTVKRYKAGMCIGLYSFLISV